MQSYKHNKPKDRPKSSRQADEIPPPARLRPVDAKRPKKSRTEVNISLETVK